jgi:flavin-dependent dehydrogenase
VAAAIQGRRLGLHTLLVDKEAFPRGKLCGGLLTVKTLDSIASLCPGIAVSELYEIACRDVGLYFKGRLVTRVQPEHPYFLANRRDFDNHLVQYYLALGGQMAQAHVKGIDPAGQRVLTESHAIPYKKLVVADGANSSCRRKLWPGFRPKGFCLEKDVEAVGGHWENYIRILFGNLEEGYSWLFPKTGRYTIGTGWRKRRGHDFHSLFGRLPQLLGMPGLNVRQPKGAFIPTGRYMRKPYYGEHILFAGDAAGLVDPITGEGIYMAVESGRMAARAAQASLKGARAHSGRAYRQSIRGIQSIVRTARVYQKIVYLPFVQKLYFHLLKGRKGFMRYYLDEIMSTYRLTYSNILWRYLWRKLVGRLLNGKKGGRVS